MANYRKSFNFRSGVQVDNDRFIVDGRGNVGVGTSAPNRELDIIGSARVSKKLESNEVNVSGASTFTSRVTIGSSIFLNSTTGIITALSFRGDGTQLDGVIAIATDGWVKKTGTLSTSFNVYIGLTTDVTTARFQVGTGSSVLVIDNIGDVGIGTTNPLTRVQIGSGSSIIVATDSGFVGIGTTAPQGTLQVNSGNSSFIIDTTGNVGVGTNVLSSNYKLKVHGSATNAFIQVTNDTEGSGDNRGLILGYDSTNNRQFINSWNLPLVLSTSASTAPVVIQPTTLNRRVGIGSTQPNNKLDVIGGVYVSGSIGIGTTNPTSKLDVQGDVRVTGVATIFNQEVTAATITTLNSTQLNPTNLNVSGIASFAQGINVTGTSNVANVQSSGTITASTFSGSLSGTATNATNLLDGANITTGTINDARLPDVITSNLNSTTGISTVSRIRALNSIGIGTETFAADFQIRKDTDTVLEIISNQGNASIGLGSNISGTNPTSQIIYNPISQVLDFNNFGSGEVTFHVHKGNGAVVGTQTGGFFFRSGSDSRILLNMAYDGRVSVNESVPLLTDFGYKFMVNGNAKIRGKLDLDAGINAGIITATSLNIANSSTFPTTQNFNTQSGLSTFNQLRVSTLLNIAGVSTFTGISTFNGGVIIGSPSGSSTSPLNIYSTATLTNTTLGLSTSKIYYDYVGGITTGFTDPRNQTLLAQYQTSIPNNGILPFSGYGDIQIRSGGINIISQDYIAVHPSLAASTTGSWPGLSGAQNVGMGLEFINNNLCKVGFNTLYIRSTFDVGYGNSANSSYFIPPRLSTAELNIVRQLWNPAVAGPSAGNWTGHARANLATPDGIVSGGIVFDTTAAQLKVGIGTTTFCGIATFTDNNTGFGAFIPPTMTTTQRNTMTNAGISSGAIIYNSTSDRLEVRLKGAWFGITTAV